MVRSTVNGILPYVFSYISHFVCLYNFNYTGRPLRGPGIIGIKLKGRGRKLERSEKMEKSENLNYENRD